MLDLSPVKLLVILVVALVVLGPDKLPGLARQIGAAWGDLRRWREKLEAEVRSTFPDLPTTERITEVVRSPLGYLDRLADDHARSMEADAADDTSASVEPHGPSRAGATPLEARSISDPPPLGGPHLPGTATRAPWAGAETWETFPTSASPSGPTGGADHRVVAVPDDPSMN